MALRHLRWSYALVAVAFLTCSACGGKHGPTFCESVRNAHDISRQMGKAMARGDTDKAKKLRAQLHASIEQSVSAAPHEIKDAMREAATTENNHGSPFDQRQQDALDAVDRYILQKCGISTRGG